MSTLVAVSAAGTLTTSPDGVTWTSRTSGFGTTSINAAAWSPGLSLFVAAGAYGTLATSPDGITWTARSYPTGVGLNAVAWSPGLNLFVAVGASGALGTSPDGITWTTRTSGFGTDPINAVAWSPGLNLFVAVGAAIITSPDGINWTGRSGFGTTLFGVAWSPVLNLFATIGISSVGTSPDGITWTARSYPTGNGTAVAWSAGLNLFVAVNSSGGLTTSPDGVTWTSRTSGFGTAAIRAVAWSPGLNLFVAVGAGGTLGTSPDGITWTTRTSGFGTNAINAVASGLDASAPYAPPITAPANVTLDRGVIQRLSWTFSDPNFGDTQSKFDLQWRQGAGAWQPVTGTSPNNFWDAPAATFPAGSTEWQVRTYDSGGLLGPYSTSSFFTAADMPAGATITAPTSGATVSSATTLTWSAPSQTDYQYRRVADNAGAADTATIYYDSGDVVDGVTRSQTAAFPVNGRWEHVQVRIKYAGLWTSWADTRVNVSFTAPMVPTITATPNSATASITIAITNPAPTGGQPLVTSNDVWISAPGVAAYRAATGVPPNSAWTWWLPGAGVTYTVWVVAIGNNGTTSTSP